MNPMNNVSFAEINALIEEYRDRCLWFLAPRYTPTTPDEAMRTLNLIERYGGVEVVNPATGEILGRSPIGSPEEVGAARVTP